MSELQLRNSVTPQALRDRYLAAGLWNDDTLVGRVRAWPGERIAVVDRKGARRHSYAELVDDALKLATYLRERGVGRGDVVSVQLPNEYETAVVAIAIQMVAAVINPILPNYRQKEVGYIFSTAQSKVIFTPALYRGFDYRPMLAELKGGVHHIVVDAVERGGDACLADILRTTVVTAADAFTGPDAAAVSELIFTSGTEANPKAIMHTEQTANFSVRIAYRDMEMSADDVVWMPSPVGHSTGFNYGLRFALFHGLKLVLQDVWDAREAEQLIRTEQCSYTLAATTFLQDLVESAEASGRPLPFRCFGCGGAPVPPELVERAQKVGIQVLRLYGSTEVLVATWNRKRSVLEKRMFSDGKALSQVELEIRGDTGAVATPGEPGEIFIRGPNTSVGFFNDPERTAATYDAAGWVRSGDMAVMDADGYIRIVGRRKEIIIRGGLNIAPREIEDLLLSFPEVERAAVLPIPDDRLGERCCAAVVFRSGHQFNFSEMLNRLQKAGMAKYKWPERLVAISTMPTTASGKIQKHRIVDLLLSKNGSAGQDEEIRLLSDSETA
jgi:acyl-CoA synthetase (AMP-forming)/AMP-acid ligase II